GYEISKSFREMEKDTQFRTAIIGISAHASDNKELIRDAGMDEMLCKPLLMDQAKALLVRYGISGSVGGSPAI
ncbi:MAG: hypothetical protein Q8929_17310, partial [Bacillota bacterium]|nr:hypothetical protein [Bacillota bacterium]